MIAADQTSVRQEHRAIFWVPREPATIPGDGDPAAVTQRGFEFCGLPMSVGVTLAAALARTFDAPRSDRAIITTFINPLAFHLARHNRAYAETLGHFDLVLPDGIGIVWGLRLLEGIRTQRLSFDSTSLALPVLLRARLEGRGVMLIGGARGAGMQAGRRLTEAVPGLRIVGTMNGFQSFRAYEKGVRRAKPDIIICGMGAPRQEQLLIRLKGTGAWNGLGFTCGGYFDQLQRKLHYYPAAIDSLNLRWLYRLIKEPRRLFRRYTLEYQDYLYALMREALHRTAKGV
jgi:N-acetylglucosaminyldiphosphoundecaprenol N-acetyl-beta-D-mannosaminyltransferase